MRPEYRRKKRLALLRAAAMLLALLFALPALPLPEARAAENGMVRVKLTRLGSHSEMVLAPTCDYYVQEDPSIRIDAGEKAVISAEGSAVYLTVDGEKHGVGTELRLMRSAKGVKGLKFSTPSMSNLYCGDLFMTASASILIPILHIYMEDYLCGVVGYEMSPSADLEALKAQAVAARNYALRKMRDRSGKSYHVVDTSSNQVFKGYSSSSTYARAVQAVEDTKGMVLYSGSALAQCYYGSSNGGQTESTKNAWGNSLKYSVVKDDPYDLESTGTVKSAELRKDAGGLNENLEAALIAGVVEHLAGKGVQVAEDGVSIDAIEAIAARDARFAEPSRLYQTLAFTVNATVRSESGELRRGEAEVEVPTYGALESWYALSINSGSNETVWVQEDDSAFTVSFRRNGHGVGMSQRGAQVMAKKYGCSCAEILEFYYPGTRLGTVSLEDTTEDRRPEVEYTVIATAKARPSACLYRSASVQSGCVAALSEGDAVEIYAVSGSWSAAGCGAATGFIPTASLSGYVPAGEKVTQAAGKLYAVVSADSAALRALPHEDASQAASLKKGDPLRVYAYTANWVAVLTKDGEAGFAKRSSLSFTKVQPTATPAPTDPVVTPEDDMYAKAAEAAALREKADSLSAQVGTLAKGEYVRVKAYNSTWACVLTRTGATGYALREQLVRVEASEALATPTPAPTSEVVTPQEDAYARVVADTPVYKSASETAGSVTKLNAGEVVQVLAYTDEWVRALTSTGYKGYLPRAAVERISAEEALATPTPAPGQNAGKVTKIKGKEYRYIADASAKMYESYSEQSQLMHTLPYGARVQIGAYNEEWGCVKYGGRIGFIRLEALTSKSPASRSASDVIRAEFNACAKKQAKVYSRADAESSVLGVLGSGQRVRVHAYNNAYAYISVGDRYGYVAIKYLKIVV